MKITVRNRLLAGLAAMGVALCLIAGVSWLSATAAGGRIQTIIVDRVAPMQALKVVSDMYAVNIVDAVHKARSGAFTQQQAIDSVKQAKSLIQTNWAEFNARGSVSPEEQALIDAANASLPAADAATARLEAILASGDRAALAQFADNTLYPAIDPLTAAIGALVDLEARVAREEAAAAQHAFRLSLIAMGVISLLAILTLISATRFVLTGVTAPLDAMTRTMRRLAAGELQAEIPGVGRRDELGEMAAALVVFRDAAEAKRKADADLIDARAAAERERQAAGEAVEREQQALVVRSFGVGLSRLADGELTYRIRCDLPPEYAQLRDDFNRAMDQLQEAIGVVLGNVAGLRSGAGEITQASDDLARRTEQQAASLEETAAALDEITVNINKTASGARQASDVVQAAKGDAETSGVIVRDAVEAMQAIEGSSNEISQIIGVIDEIAFQTNLLALNAGVEAARAGEAGRGFAVVASEVRALAQRSADAAKEIKTLISTSTSQVGSGVKLVGQTGEALQRIVDRVAEIDGLVADIAASAQDQAVGLAQVNTAVSQMDQVTQQNAAMVEQSTAASHALAQDAQSLQASVAQFKVGDTVPAQAPSQSSTESSAGAPRVASRSAATAPARSTHMAAALKTIGRGGVAPVSQAAPQTAVQSGPAADGWEEF